jgi:hypothetical protein
LRSQLAAPSSGHSPSGSVAVATVPQTPLLPVPFLATVQARQVPVQAWSQHTPSAQNPDTHSFAFEHAAPFALSPSQADDVSLQ